MGAGNTRELYDDPEMQDKLCKLPPDVMDVALRGMMTMHDQESETLLRILYSFRNHVRECKKIMDMTLAAPVRPKRLQSARQNGRQKSGRPKSRKTKRDKFRRTTSSSSLNVGDKRIMTKYGLDLGLESGMESGSSSASDHRKMMRHYGVESGFESGMESDLATTYQQVDETRDILVELDEQEQSIAKKEAMRMVDELARKDAQFGKEQMRHQEMIQEKLRAKKDRAVNVATNMVKDVDRVHESYAQEKDRQKEKMREMLEEKQRRKREKEAARE